MHVEVNSNIPRKEWVPNSVVKEIPCVEEDYASAKRLPSPINSISVISVHKVITSKSVRQFV